MVQINSKVVKENLLLFHLNNFLNTLEEHTMHKCPYDFKNSHALFFMLTKKVIGTVWLEQLIIFLETMAVENPQTMSFHTQKRGDEIFIQSWK